MSENIFNWHIIVHIAKAQRDLSLLACKYRLSSILFFFLWTKAKYITLSIELFLRANRSCELFTCAGVLCCKFHPRQPWLFTAGADSVIKLYCDWDAAEWCWGFYFVIRHCEKNVYLEKISLSIIFGRPVFRPTGSCCKLSVSSF